MPESHLAYFHPHGFGEIEMNVTLGRWDPADHPRTDADIQKYLVAILDEGRDDPAHVVHAIGVNARAETVSQLARDAGLSREELYEALSEEGNLIFSTVAKIAKALGLKIKLSRQRSNAH